MNKTQIKIEFSSLNLKLKFSNPSAPNNNEPENNKPRFSSVQQQKCAPVMGNFQI